MHFVISLAAFITTLCTVVSGQQPSLNVKPPGDSMLRSAGSSIMFTCEVKDAVEGTDYQLSWSTRPNDQAEWSRITDNRSNSRYVDGTENPDTIKLFVTQIVDDDAGIYRCIANIDDEEQFKDVTLQVFKDISFDFIPVQNPKIYTDALIKCQVDGMPEPEVSWTHNGARINFARSTRHGLVHEGLRISNITTEDNGLYMCRAEVTSDGRYDDKKITVDVHIPPTISTGLETHDGIEGEPLSIACSAEGRPQPTYFFTKGDDSEHLQSTDRFTVDASSGRLDFTELLKSDEGSYTCTAVNDVGEATSTGRLNVRVKPSIYEFVDTTGNEEQSVTLTCKSHGDPLPEITFHKAGSDAVYLIGENEDGKVLIEESGDGGKSLTVNNLQPTDAASYTCRAVNDVGFQEMTATITVHYKPRIEEREGESTIYAWVGQERELTCRAIGEPKPTFEWFAVSEPLTETGDYHIETSGDGSTSHLQVTVHQATLGQIFTTYRCVAKNELGEAEQSTELLRATEPDRPASVESTKVLPTIVELQVAPPEDNGGQPVTGFHVVYKAAEDSELHELPETALDFTVDEDIVVRHLHPNTAYTIRVSAVNAVGTGEATVYTVTTQPTRRPSAAVITSESSSSSAHTYTVTGEIPANGGLSVTKVQYKLREVVNGSEPTDWITVDDTSVHGDNEPLTFAYILDKLKEKTTYELQVLAENELGWSDANEYFEFSTAEDPDQILLDTSTVLVIDLTGESSSEPLIIAGTVPLETMEQQSPETGENSQDVTAASMGIGVVIGVVIIVLIIMLVIIDVTCYFINGCGVTKTICSKVRGGKASVSSKEKAMEQGEREHLNAAHVDEPENETKVTKQETELTKENAGDRKEGVATDG